MKTRLLAVLLLALACSGFGQRKPERPKIHSDFHFGSLPVSRDAIDRLSKENIRLLLVGLHNGWDLQKIEKETKISIDDLSGLFADLEDDRLAFVVDEFSSRPMLPVIREKDIDEIRGKLQAHTKALTAVFEANWSSIETSLAALQGAKMVPKDDLMYEVVAGGILWGVLVDVLFEDQTLMPPPPRRRMNERFYGWLIEGDARFAGTIKREQWESDGHMVVSVGSSLIKDRPSIEQIRSGNGMVLDAEESRRFRSFVTILSRDKLLPFFKNNRSDLFATVRQSDSGNYVRVADVFSWYYDQLANGVIESLVASGRMKAPAQPLAYAIRIR